MPFNERLTIRNITRLTLMGLGCCAVIKVATQPLVPEIKTSVLPETIHLNHWQMTQTRPEHSAVEDVSYDQLLQGKAYEYTHQDQQVKLQLGYFFNTNGDVLVLQDRLAPLPKNPESQWEEQYQEAAGRYLTGHLPSGETVLLTCINANGNNTVNREQFSENRLKHDLSIGQVFRWLIGRSQFFDQRCLWARLSLNGFESTDMALQEAEKLLMELQPHLRQIL